MSFVSTHTHLLSSKAQIQSVCSARTSKRSQEIEVTWLTLARGWAVRRWVRSQRLIRVACVLLQALNLLQHLHDQSDSLREEIQQLHHQQKVKSSTKKKSTKLFIKIKRNVSSGTSGFVKLSCSLWNTWGKSFTVSCKLGITLNKEFSLFGAPKLTINHMWSQNRSEVIKTNRKRLFFSVQMAEAQAEVVSAAEKCCLRVDTLEDTVVSVELNLHVCFLSVAYVEALFPR